MKKFTIIFSFIVVICATFSVGVMAQNNFGAGSNYYFFFLDEDTYMTVPQSKIAADYRIDPNAGRDLQIWPAAPQSYSSVDAVGPNSNGGDGFICLKVEAPEGWSGLGFNALQGTTDFTRVTGDYTFHIALKSSQTNTHAIRLYADSESSTGTIAVGSSNFLDAGKTFVPFTDFIRDNKWHSVEIPMSEFFKAGLEYHAAAGGNYLGFLSGNAKGAIISLDAIFMYKKDGQGINGTKIEKLDVFVTPNTVNVIGTTEPIEVYNLVGSKVFSTTESTFGTEELSSGAYIVKSGNAVAKIIIK